MNKKLLTLFTFLLVLTSVSQNAYALSTPAQQERKVSPEVFCSLDPVKLSRGSKGDSVVKLQKLLQFKKEYDETPPLGFGEARSGIYIPPIKIDGKFGYESKKYVQYFQEEMQLNSDGIVGAKTRAALTNWCVKHYSQTTSNNPNENLGIKKVSLGSEFTMKAGESVRVGESEFVISLVGIYGNKCAASASNGLDVACTMEYNPAVKLSGMLGGDGVVGPDRSAIARGETTDFTVTENLVYRIRLVSFSNEDTVVHFVLLKN